MQLGVFGTITPIKSPPPTLRSLFDFAMTGPLVGMSVSIAFFIYGLSLTQSMDLNEVVDLPALPIFMLRASSLGGGLIELFLGNGALTQGTDLQGILPLHPFAIAGFLGVMSNALALLPLGSKFWLKRATIS